MLAPRKEWFVTECSRSRVNNLDNFFLRPFARVIAQLSYDLYSLSCNLSPEDRRRMVELGTTGGKQFIIAMHPHGVISYQAPIWCAYCHQYLTFGDKCTYSILSKCNDEMNRYY